MKRNFLKAAMILFPVALLLAIISQARAGDAYMTDFHTDLDVWLCDGDSRLPVQFQIFDVDNLPLTSTHLAIYALDVDEEMGEIDNVYFNGNYVGHLGGVDGEWSTSLFEVPLGWAIPGNNLVRITVAPQRCIEVDWGQILIDGGEMANANLLDLAIDSYTVAASKVNIQSSAIVSVVTAGDYHVEILVTDPNGDTKVSTTDSFTALAGDLETRAITSTYGLDEGTGIYKLLAILFDDSSRKIQAIEKVSFYHDFGVGPILFDFGDAPDPAYPTTLASNGARHRMGGGLYMGAGVDVELDGQPDETASGDDVLDGNDDEDGVTFGVLRQGATAPVTVTVSGEGYLNAWADFNADGDWADVGEPIFVRQGLTTGTHQLSFLVPGKALTGTVFTRFRYDSGGALSYVGEANDGEVEDHVVAIEEMNLALFKTAEDLNGPPLFRNDLIQYTVTVINASTADKTNVVVTDTLPAGVRFLGASKPGYAGPNPLVWNVGLMATGTVWDVNIFVQVDGTANPIGGNIAAVSSDEQDMQVTEPIYPPDVDIGDWADGLAVLKTATDVNGAPLQVGDEIRYAITVTNDYTDTMTNVVVSDTLPAGVTFVSATPVTYTGPNPLMWNAGDLYTDTVWTAVVTVVVDGTANPIGSNVAAASSDQQYDQPSNPALPPGGGDVELNPGALELVKIAQDLNDAPLQPSDEILYTIYATNALLIEQRGVVITDAIPSGTTYVPDSASTSQGSITGPDPLVVDVGTLAAGQVVTFSFQVEVDSGAVGQTIENFAEADSDQQEPPLIIGPIEPPGGGAIDPIVDALEFTKMAQDLNDEPLIPGDEILYTMYMTNAVDIVQTGVVITDAIPSGTTYVSGSALSSQGAISGPDPLVVDVGTIAVGQVVTFSFRVAVNADAMGQTVGNLALTDSVQNDPPVQAGPVEPPDGGMVEPSSSALEFYKMAEDLSGLPLYPDDTILYTMYVTNSLNVAQTNVVITDAIPDNVTYILESASASQGTITGPDPLVLDIGTLAVGEVVTFSFRVMVNGDAVGLRIINFAQCDSDQQAPPIEVGPVEPAGEVQPIVLTANLAITKDFVRPEGAGLITYTVTVYNFGPNSAHGAIMRDDIGPQIHNVSWTCEASLGTSCPPDGTANTLSVMVYSFPPNGVVTFTISGELDILADDSNIATISPPQGVGDPDLRDNTAIVGRPYRILLSMVLKNKVASTAVFPRDW